MAPDYWNAACKAAGLPGLPDGFFVMRPEAAMLQASLPRVIRELNIWRMAKALRVDMVEGIKSGRVTRDSPLDLLHSMTQRCAACDRAVECARELRASNDSLQSPPEFCRIKNRLSDLASQMRPGHSQAS